MPSQWQAVGAETDPLRRARELQGNWERLLGNGALGLELPPAATAGLRPEIVESWRRSLTRGLDPTDSLAPIEADESEVLERWFEHPLGSLTEGLMDRLRQVAEESRGMVVVTDASGLVLHRVGDEWLKERAAEMNLVEGARYSEAADGTNGIGTALAADHAFEVFAFEHFNERHHEWVCSGAPVHDPMTGETIGLIDLSSLWKLAHPSALELATATARAMEQRLFEGRRNQDARLKRRYSDLLTRSTDLLVNREGYILAGAEPAHVKPLEVPEGGGEVVLGDGSVAVAASVGQGEAYLLRRVITHHAKSAPLEGLERAEKHVRELVAEQAALRQVATLVARESSPHRLFAAVAEQVARVFGVQHVRLVRYEPEASEIVGGFTEGDREPFPLGSRWPQDIPGVMATVRETGRPARVEDYACVPGETAAAARAAGLRSAVASPIVVGRRLWGAIVVFSLRDERFPADTEARLADFTELVATAIANAESRGALATLADEQAALSRVATLVASGTGPDQLFAAVADEVHALLGADTSAVVRFEDDGTAVTVGAHAAAKATGEPYEIRPHGVVACVRETRRAARFDSDDPAAADMRENVREAGVRSAVANPIVVEGELWGVVVVASRSSLPPATEARLASFTELVAIAIANAESRDALARLADEQAALRRVATLVARGASARDLVDAVAEEVGRRFPVGTVTIGRFEPDETVTTVASWSSTDVAFPRGKRWPTRGANVAWMVLQTGRAARIDDFSAATDPIGVAAREAGYRSAVGSPIVVEGHLYGLITATSTEGALPPGTEARLASFTELVATAIANAKSSAELTASRRRIVAAADEARRRIERDLHDGIQQRLIALTFRARAMARSAPDELPGLATQLAEGMKDASDELREVSRGIHPTILTEAGLGPALRALARRSEIPIGVAVGLDERLPAEVETAAYYIASEALTNVAKHAQASTVELSATHDDRVLTLEIRDDGIGGVDASRGSGILGLTDRIEALDGSISISSPPRGGTKLRVQLPIAY
jgi:signal transduction histidine kinase